MSTQNWINGIVFGSPFSYLIFIQVDITGFQWNCFQRMCVVVIEREKESQKISLFFSTHFSSNSAQFIFKP